MLQTPLYCMHDTAKKLLLSEKGMINNTGFLLINITPGNCVLIKNVIFYDSLCSTHRPYCSF